MDFQLPKRFILPKLEEQLAATLLQDSPEISLLLPRDRDRGIFKESRASAVIATLGSERKMRAIDQHHSWEDDTVSEHYQRSLVGITAVRCATNVANQNKIPMPADANSLFENIYCSGGILETPDSRGRSTTVCAIDPEWGEPPTTANKFTSLETFIPAFRELRASLELGALPRKTEEQRNHDKHFCELVYELYQNTREHARKDPKEPDDNYIRGIRFFSMKRHIGTQQSFLRSLDGFDEATDYIRSLEFRGKDMNLWEVSVGDHGHGIVDHYQATRGEYQAALPFPEDEASRLNHILTKTVTSKRVSGAGSGLFTALRAIRLLKGFISLRTGAQWVYGSSNSSEPLEESGLRPVRLATAPARIRGTWYNFLFPLLGK